LTKLLPYILFEKYIYILALEMASPGNQHCANCIGALSFLIVTDVAPFVCSLSAEKNNKQDEAMDANRVGVDR